MDWGQLKFPKDPPYCVYRIKKLHPWNFLTDFQASPIRVSSSLAIVHCLQRLREGPVNLVSGPSFMNFKPCEFPLVLILRNLPLFSRMVQLGEMATLAIIFGHQGNENQNYIELPFHQTVATIISGVSEGLGL